MMEIPSALLTRFPAREFEISRLCARDEDFRSACEDYEDAAQALRLWEVEKHNAVRANEYRQLLREIGDEIVACLDAASTQRMTKFNARVASVTNHQ